MSHGSEKRRLTSEVLVRLPDGTVTALRRAAREADLSEAAWIRSHLVGILGTDPADKVSVPARLPARPRPTVDVLEVARLREAVGEAVGTLRQVAGLDRHSRQGARLQELDAAIDRLIAAAAELDAAKRHLIIRGDPG